jgi:hypothetical protein
MIKNLSEVEGYEKYKKYSVTSNGEVISHYKEEDIILKPGCDKDGYLKVCLYVNKKRKTAYIALLVARAFCNGYSPELEVDHINEIRTDNRSENLQYLTHKKNIQKSKNIPVKQLTLKGKIVKDWQSAREAERQGGFKHSAIARVCLGKSKTHAGYKWKYAE